MPNITTNHAIIFLYSYYPQRFGNFHMWVFQIKVKYHCSNLASQIAEITHVVV